MNLNRYTKKSEEDNYTCCDYEIVTEVPGDELDMQQWANNKLGCLENIEDELGITLTTLFKAITVGFYYKGISNQNNKYIGFARGKRIDRTYFRVNNHPYYFKDYGKTWALTKEDLK